MACAWSLDGGSRVLWVRHPGRCRTHHRQSLQLCASLFSVTFIGGDVSANEYYREPEQARSSFAQSLAFWILETCSQMLGSFVASSTSIKKKTRAKKVVQGKTQGRGLLIGYARVSTQDQNLELQTEALQKAGCKKIFEDRISGTRAERPGLAKARENLRGGDTLVVWKLDRLGRSVKHLVVSSASFSSRGSTSRASLTPLTQGLLLAGSAST